MKQELMKYSDLQDRWKTSVKVTCHVVSVIPVLEDWVNRVIEVLKQFLEDLARVCIPMIESLSEAFKELSDKFVPELKDLLPEKYSYPQSYPHYVHNLKLNTRGFPQPIIQCARSRC